jgi:hypothetical protein
MVPNNQTGSVLLAQVGRNFGGSLEGIGPLGTVGGNISDALELFFKILSAIVGIMTICAAIWFVFQFFIGAIQIIASGGDKTKIQEASTRITHAVIGIVVVISAIFFISLIGSLTGLKILGPWDWLTKLWPATSSQPQRNP